TAPQALSAALDAQHAYQSAIKDGPTVVVRVRMGLHTGAAEFLAGEYHGYLTLVRVQRVMSLAHGGQVLLSQTTADLTRDMMPAGVSLRSLGEHRLKGLAQPEPLWQVVAPKLPSDFPTLPLLESIINNLPIQVNSF